MVRNHVQIRMLTGAHQALRKAAVERGMTLGEFVELMCERCGVWEPPRQTGENDG